MVVPLQNTMPTTADALLLAQISVLTVPVYPTVPTLLRDDKLVAGAVERTAPPEPVLFIASNTVASSCMMSTDDAVLPAEGV
jgi:hypothetical protein